MNRRKRVDGNASDDVRLTMMSKTKDVDFAFCKLGLSLRISVLLCFG